MQKQARELAAQIRRDPNRSEEERLAILQAMQAETRKSLNDALGSSVFRAYEKNFGGWLNQMNKVEE